MNNRVFRILVAVVLVCCLVVSWSPIRVSAVPVSGWDGFAWNLAEIIASGAIGIGTSPGSVPDDWNIMIENAKQAWRDFTGAVDDTLKIYSFFNGSHYKYYVKADFVEWLRGWMFDSGSVSCSSAVSHSFSLDGNSYVVTSEHPFDIALFWRTGFSYYAGVVVVAYTPIVDGVSSLTITCGEASYHSRKIAGYYVTYMMGSSGTSYENYCWDTSLPVIHDSSGFREWDPLLEKYLTGGVSSNFYSDLDISLGKISSPDKLLGDAYPEWVQNSVYIPAEVAGTEEDVLALPLGLGQTLTETEGLTQEQIWTGESTLEVEIEEALEGTVSGTTWFDFTTWFGQKLEWISKQILEGITAIFVPTEDFLTAKWEAIRAEFAFADSITATGEVLVDILDGLDPEPPVIYIDLGATEGSYNLGGEVAFIDLRWYARYKPTMDLIISAFLWMAFVWRLILKLPGIISGMPGEFFLMNLPVNLPQSGLGSGQRREYLEAGHTNRRLGDGH